ncbi:hypothetical protein F0562_021552 [Nyssa sinensis]|uniref:Uncharacterized protein n=1 Tax=Nyssa sinensis TaxID=561372 RepID=A0A5J5BPP2_9ASTE|nr:hypothetical protein F0562_021552 [Nyssa sinensis]
MNAVSNSAAELMEENAGGSDSDTNPDESPEYYQPISAGDDVDEDLSDEADSVGNSDENSNFHRLPNGYGPVENGISSLDLSDEEEPEGDEDEEEDRTTEASNSAILRAFGEDESRRNAPLTPENAIRVMDAMRGISFGGVTPDWADRVPEDQWIHQLRRLRRSPTPIQD